MAAKTNILGRMFGDVSREGFQPPVDQNRLQAASPSHSMMASQAFAMMGIVAEIYPPTHPQNISKNQYEFLVKAVGRQRSYVPVRCVLRDMFGGNNDYEQFSIRKNQRVVVLCLIGDPREGVIVGALKNRMEKDPENLGHHWVRRFNQITERVSKDSARSIKHDDGNEFNLDATKISLKDGAGTEVEVDKSAKTITITDGKGQKIVVGGGKITVEGTDIQVNSSGKTTINAKGDVDIKGGTIKLNGGKAPVVTGGPGGSHPVDFITGAPIMGVPKVKAG